MATSQDILDQARLIFSNLSEPLTHVVAEVEDRPAGDSIWVGVAKDGLHFRVVASSGTQVGQCVLSQPGVDELRALIGQGASLPPTSCPQTRRIFGLTDLYVVSADSPLHYSRAPSILDSSGQIRAWGLRMRSLIGRLCPELRDCLPNGFVISEKM